MKKTIHTMEIPMSKRHQTQIGRKFLKVAKDSGHMAILCQPRVFAPHLGGVWQMNPRWQIAFLPHELCEKVQAVLVEFHTGQSNIHP